MACFVDPSAVETSCQSVEGQLLGGDVNKGIYYLDGFWMKAVAYNDGIQNFWEVT